MDPLIVFHKPTRMKTFQIYLARKLLVASQNLQLPDGMKNNQEHQNKTNKQTNNQSEPPKKTKHTHTQTQKAQRTPLRNVQEFLYNTVIKLFDKYHSFTLDKISCVYWHSSVMQN